MSAIKLTDRVYSVGVLNPNLRVFDIVMRTDYGTSYNSYIVRGGGKTALVDTCHHSFFGEYIENIRSVCDPAEIDYIILNHTEPDHSGALGMLTDICPSAQIICSKAAALYLKNITNKPELTYRVAADGDEIDLGGRTLRFISAPFLHWPDSMFTNLVEDGVLFTCDFMGSHYCEPRMLDLHVTYPAKYRAALRDYYNAIFGPFPAYVRAGRDKVTAAKPVMICPSHGPVLTEEGMMDYVWTSYTEWSSALTNASTTIPVFYCSAYGNTRRLADKFSEGVKSVIPNAICETYDIIENNMPYLAGLLNSADAFALGSPTINRDAVPPVWELIAHVDAINSGKKPAAVFGSYGWSGEAVPSVCARLTALRFKVFEDGLRVCFVPSEAELEAAYNYGERFAQSL